MKFELRSFTSRFRSYVTQLTQVENMQLRGNQLKKVKRL